MNILVLNGSPKGNRSVTYQTIKFMEVQNKEHVFDVCNVGVTIKI